MAELTLEIVEGADAGRQVALSGPVEVGRDPRLPLVVEDDQVSRRHALIQPSEPNAVVQDLNSTNGTFVNDQPIHSARTLVPGDRVRLGLTVLELRSSEQVAQQPSAVQPIPQITRIGQDVLRPVPQDQLPGGPASPAVAAPAGEPAPAAAVAAPPAGAPLPPPAAAPAAAPPTPAPPPFRAQERAPGFVPPEAVGDPEAESDFNALAALVDKRVKRQTTIALFAIFAIAALALLIFFGAR